MVSDKTLANVVGGKTARACDSCIGKRARWYCAADDAFLCQSCDGSVHAANPLARRHERIPLKTTSSFEPETPLSLPAWHHGFTRKARTPRHGRNAIHRVKNKPEESVRNPVHHLVPEMGTDQTTSHEDINEEQLRYRVPIFDGSDHRPEATWHGFFPSDMELANFAADVESLLGKGTEEESFDMEGSCGRVKVEEEEEEDGDDVDINQIRTDIDMTSEPLFELNFDLDSPQITVNESEEYEVKKKVLLTLDYDRVITAWADQRSPWTTAHRPELDPNNYWPDCMGASATLHYPYGADMGIKSGQTTMMDGGREARVSRYREKRRTRLFSKKIRYEVRKLNAEKRPRMKGRFVKRANFAEPVFPLLNK